MEDFAKNTGLVYYVFNKSFQSNRSIEEDLIQEGMIGLWRACNSFDSKKGTEFSTYAVKCIKNAMYMYMRKENKKANDVVSLEDLREGQADDRALCLLCWDDIDMHMTMERLIEEFDDDTTKRILNMRIDGKTQSQIAKELHISPTRIYERLSVFYKYAKEKIEKS